MADCKSSNRCLRCQGSGAVYMEAKGVGYRYYLTCPYCHGSGLNSPLTGNGAVDAAANGFTTCLEVEEHRP